MSILSAKPRKGLLRKTKPSASTEMSPVNSVLPTDRDIHSSIILLRTCSEVNVARFKECLCKANFKVLIIEGVPTDDQLIAAWQDIIMEYGSLVTTADSSYLFDLQKLIAETELHLEYVENALLYLRRRYDQQMIDQLIEYGYHGNYNYDDREQYLKQLDRIKSLAKTKAHDLEDLRLEYKRNSQLEGEQKPKTEADFDEELAMLSRFQHYPINEETTMMTKYAGVINSYMKEIKRLSKIKEVDHG